MLIDSATDESEANSPQDDAARRQRRSGISVESQERMRSKLVIAKINEMKMKLGRKVVLRKSGNTKVDSEISIKAVNSAKRKHVEQTMHKAYWTLPSSEMQAETIEQMVSPLWKAVVLRYFEEEMRTTPKINAQIAVPYVRTELQLRFA